jgi:biotin carboxyl carrier protein
MEEIGRMEDVTYDDGIQSRRVQIRRDQGRFIVAIDNESHIVQAELLSPGQLQITMDNRVYKCVVAREGNCRHVFLNGKVYELTKVEKTALTARDLGLPETMAREQEKEGDVVSPMPGRIVKILIQEGDLVETGQDLLIVEAMKMENRIVAPFSGRVTRIHFQVGDQVSNGTPLVDLEPATKEDKAKKVQA